MNLASKIAVLLCATGLSAQPKADRRTHAWIQDLRHDLTLACRGKSSELIAGVARARTALVVTRRTR